MFLYLLIGLTFVILGVGMWYAYSVTRDPLHPLMFLAPLCVYAYVYKPVVFAYLGVLDVYFDWHDLIYVQMINLLGTAAFCIGVLWHSHGATMAGRTPQQTIQQLEAILTPGVRRRSVDMAYLLGGISLGAYWLMTLYVGGLTAVYGQAKGGISAASGYLGEAPMFSLPAIGLLYFAWAGRRFTPGMIALLLLFASPLIVHGLLGARRGPTFMILAGLLVGGYAVSQRRPRLLTVFVTVFLIGSLLLFLVNNRGRIFLSSDALEEWTNPTATPLQTTVDSGEDWIFSSGLIITSRETGTHFWGARYLVNMLVRPIPRQLWPTKYVDTGFGWLDDQADMEGMSDNEWVASVGWVPVRGAAAGFIADFYLEFSYLGIVGCYFIGWLYGYLWRNMVRRGGIWAILYLYAAVLSIYVPTQNVTGAWLYRLLLFSIPTIIVWRFYISPPALSARVAVGASAHRT
jgi:hypothetical protein